MVEVLDCHECSSWCKEGHSAAKKLAKQNMKTIQNSPIGGAVTNSVDKDVSGLAARRHGAAGLGPCSNSSECPNILRVGSLNVGTLKGKGNEVVEMLSRKRLDFCCAQETRWKTLVKIIDGKNLRYKYFGSSLGNKFGGLGILLSEKWWENVYEVTRVSNRIIVICLVIGKKVFAIISMLLSQT